MDEYERYFKEKKSFRSFVNRVLGGRDNKGDKKTCDDNIMQVVPIYQALIPSSRNFSPSTIRG